MKEVPVNDFMSENAVVRKDGRVIRDMHLFEVKKPGGSKYAWDYYKHVQTLSGSDVCRPLSEGGCAMAI
jgi:branched-chain amino acid transport system substrate-binding protein